jgi:ATP-dependent DNA helicase RecQ
MLNNQQLEVLNYDYINRPNALCVIAGAGSGKTTTIISKIVKMINDDKLNPKHFFITTFTRNAALSLKTKLKNYLSEEIINKMTIGTFHSIAHQYLNTNNDLKFAQSYDKLLADYLQLINQEIYTDTHKYIFIDEYQDIDPLQNQIIYQLFNKYPDNFLVVIGDDQQNIYTFRGSTIKFILEFQGSILKLETNYRCFPAIVKISNYLLSYNNSKIDKTFTVIGNI